MEKIKISLTVAEKTLEGLDELVSLLFPHITVSRGDVMDYLVPEALRVIHERGTAVNLFPQPEKAEVRGK